ncbi:site-specific integrase [Agriterribacter sp.]|uniref:site-specific integrase n=1 Tax=Agriterribacter sp. TaxID=2821509 RepID=UPI002CCE3AD9|nr:site-specific integrase [Agriterribacter sp.]HRO45131.1 site-specific integrase [Agriterribacter sp.]HRQ15428.1 site-specific integrase [Agriterribacter sp.]
MGKKSIVHTATSSIVLDQRRELKDGTYPVKIRITFQRKQVYYSTPHALSEDYYKVALDIPLNDKEKKVRKPLSKTIKSKLKEVGTELRSYENKAVAIIKELPSFTWQDFEKSFLTNRSAQDVVNLAFAERIRQLRAAGQIGTAVTYECAQASLNNFLPGAKFSDITPDKLNEYERFMLEKNNSKTTISMYLRSLRAIFNIAISNKDILPALYPFRRNENEKNKYQIPEGRNIKKALKISAIEKVFDYKALPGSSMEMAKDYWIFLYLGNGMNVKDLCLLKYKDIDKSILKFKRAKTIRQKKEKIIYAVLQPEARAIIKKWGNKKKDGDTFIFPVLTGKETPERQYQLIQQLTHVINDNMREISKDLKITPPLTTYTARHSFATVLKRSGTSIDLISEMLGHSNLRTTQNYLDSFENETLRTQAKALTAFKKTKAK